jgi:hypothetical protein
METGVRYRTLLFAPIVTLEADGRYVASAVITNPTNEDLTVDVDARHESALDGCEPASTPTAT